MIDRLFNSLFDLRLLRLFKAKTTPRWIILLIDMLIVVASYALTILAELYADNLLFTPSEVLIAGGIFLLVYFLVTYISKSYTCVIRLSVIEDLYRVFLVVLASSVILAGIDAVAVIFTGRPLYRFWNVLTTGTIAFSLMVMERLVIKYLYMRITTISAGRNRVLVLGTSLDSLILANALKNEIGGKYEPVGLLSTKSRKENEVINGFKVYRFDPDSTANTFVENGIHALIINN
ncbi:MAG: hypothetical protein IJ808_04915, partial [Muribaculaceae bacterium]|nr:hypothetical protein [Muribaculaceae bacterium]